MPIYEYQCDDCGASIEVMQKMSDDPLEVCERCGGHLHKVLHPVAIHFKGSGFYTTDYGRGSGSGRSTGARDGSSTDADSSSGASSDNGGEAKAAKPDKPAAKGSGKEKKAAT